MKRKSLWKTIGASALVFSLTLSTALSVQAAVPQEVKNGDKKEGKTSGDTVPIPVWGFRGPVEDGAPNISVDVEWGAMTFQYVENTGSERVWDPQTHSYKEGDGADTGEWKVSGDEGAPSDSKETNFNKITVINHSNRGVTAAFTFQGNAGLDGDFTPDANSETDRTSQDTLKIATADNRLGEQAGEGEGVGQAVEGAMYFMPKGPYPAEFPEQTEENLSWQSLGNISVSIAGDSGSAPEP